METGTEAPKPASALEAIKMPHYCLGPAMHASMAIAVDAPREALMKVYFTNYYEAFLDAKEQKKYVDCLEEDRAAKNFGKDHLEAEGWLKSAQVEMKNYEGYFPAEKRIVDVEQTFSDVSDKVGLARVVITLKDGTKTVEETRFDK